VCGHTHTHSLGVEGLVREHILECGKRTHSRTHTHSLGVEGFHGASCVCCVCVCVCVCTLFVGLSRIFGYGSFDKGMGAFLDCLRALQVSECVLSRYNNVLSIDSMCSL